MLLPAILILAQPLAATPLQQAKELLASPASVSRGISTLSREAQSRDPSRAVPAAVMLARYLRTHGETRKAVTVIDSYGGFDPEKLQETVLPAYLERTRCLAADARIREAVKALDFAKEKTQGHQRARVFATYADMHGIANEWDVAIKQYKAALGYGDNYYKRKNISESVEKVLSPVLPGTADWKKKQRPDIAARLKNAQRQLEIQKYGEGFVDYRDARTAHLDKKYQSAIRQYDKLITKHAGTVYSEAAQLYRAQCQEAAGDPQAALQALETFIKAAPLGLYRGEALCETGRLLLEQGDVNKAQRAFDQALEWITKVRTQARDLKLYAIPQKAQKIAAAPSAAQTLSADYDLNPADITASMVINRKTTSWYLTRLEWDTHYFLGFIAFYRGKHDDALAQFTKAFEMNKALQQKHKTTLDSFHRRLQIACRVQFLLARPAELRAFRSVDKLRFMLADFYALWEKWAPAESIYRAFLDNRRSSAPVKAAALCALATAAQHQERWPEAKTYFQKITEQYPDTPSAQRAFLTLGLESTATIEKRAQLLQKAHGLNPNTSDGERALYQIGFIYQAAKKKQESLDAFKRFQQRYPQSRFQQLVNMFIEKQRQGEI